MPNYNWICRECSIYWDRECAIGKAPERTRCPKCKKLSHRYYEAMNIGVSFNDDKDFHTVRRRYQKHTEKGYDKDSANRFLRRQIEASKNTQDDESFRYKSANFKWDKMAEDGVVKKLSDKKAIAKRERARKLTEDAYHRANKMGYKDINKTHLDITKPQKQG